MKKILVIGSCGAGKSTLAREISEKLNLPLIGLDQLYWLPGWVRPSTEVWRAIVTDLVERDKWIMEGNYQSTFDLRLPACDTVVWLDINRFVCFWRIWKRRILQNRVDPLSQCREKIDFKLMKWVLWDYPRQGRQIIKDHLKICTKPTIIIGSEKDKREFLNSL